MSRKILGKPAIRKLLSILKQYIDESYKPVKGRNGQLIGFDEDGNQTPVDIKIPSIEVEQTLQSGVKVGSITINGKFYDLYSPTVSVDSIGAAPASHTHSNATQSTDGFMSSGDKTKLDGIEEGANKYTHPSTHAGSIIKQDATHRFVSDTEKTTWNEKLNKSDVTQSSAVTTAGTKALDAIEKNASISGTLANDVKKLQEQNSPYADTFDKIVYISDSGSDDNNGRSKSKPIKTIKRFKELYAGTKHRLYIVGTLTISADTTLGDATYLQGVSADEPGTLVIESGKNLRFTSNVIIQYLTIINNDGISNYCIRGCCCMYLYKVTISGNIGILVNGMISISLIYYGGSDRLNISNAFVNIYGQTAQAGDTLNTVSYLAHMERCLIFAGASLIFPNVNGKYNYSRWAD